MAPVARVRAVELHRADDRVAVECGEENALAGSKSRGGIRICRAGAVE